MAHHEDSHGHDDHGHDMTEGNRQYYSKGWYLPLIGLVAIAFIFSLGGGTLLGMSGTDKWGKHEMCHDEKCEGHCGMEHGDAAHHEASAKDEAKAPVHRNNDSIAIARPVSDCVKVDSAKVVAPAGHNGHGH